eukprot:TRINITY_DN16265_c0_g1::TRINITY_DN16265_c0_g1_i1::g.3117::m.3117 TRINITY_DN16265_c0_g1::TRINITY_DN16265_c0_g1_i1::g.3117  ORF type:complete len:392 (+),score=16.05,sp/Q9SBJ1/PDK_ARATH/46.61/5e-94,BCDHK_Adom3/PF10436.4/3.5e-52,HATPase_c/PF02518.21/2e-18,HATPase_c_3/PF13589.1/0.00028 TRINITY_DN16265_c0_g1_i1:27-1178(+)
MRLIRGFRTKCSGYGVRFYSDARDSMLESKIDIFSHKPQTPVSLNQLLYFGRAMTPQKILTSAQFLHPELPIRVAHRIREIDRLPHFTQSPDIQLVRSWYAQTFDELVSAQRPTTDELDRKYCEILERMLNRHNNVVPQMAKGFQEFKRTAPKNFDFAQIHKFLDSFYSSRIGIRLLAGQHLALHQVRPDFVGMIETKCQIRRIIEDANEHARGICLRFYGSAPEVVVLGQRDLAIPYIPSHLYHILFELIKNSLRAVVETHKDEDDYPPVKVIISGPKDTGDSEDVTIKVSDEGGGIPRSLVHFVFDYMFTTANPVPIDPDNPYHGVEDQLAGYGYGLPISRLYARYFGGDMKLLSMEGYGTDAYVYLPQFSRNMGERLTPA